MKKKVLFLFFLVILVACINTTQDELARNKDYIYKGEPSDIFLPEPPNPPDPELTQNPVVNESSIEEPIQEVVEPIIEEPKSIKKKFSIIASQWSFKPNQILVNLGDEVTLIITSLDINDLFEIPDLGISVDLEPQSKREITFTANETGKFKFWCKGDCTNITQMEGLIYVK